MPLATGLRQRTDQVGQRRAYDVDKQIVKVMPDEASFIVLLSKIGSEECKDPKFFYYYKALCPRWDKINNVGGYSAAATSLVVDNGSYFRVGDILKVPRTKETIRVDNVASNTLTVTRSIGATAAATLNDNEDLLIIGNSNEEGSVSRIIKTMKEVEQYNYLQIFKTPFGVTNTEKNSTSLGTATLEDLRVTELVTHRSDIERGFIFGEKSEDTSGDAAERTTGGLIESITQTWDFGLIPTEDEFENFCEQLFKIGSKTKLLLCSRAWITHINRWGRHKLEVKQDDSTYGISIVTYKSAHGTLKIIPSDILEGSVFGYYFFALDIKHIKLKHLPGRKHIWERDIQANNQDATQEQYLSEVGIQVKNPDAHYIGYYGQ